MKILQTIFSTTLKHQIISNLPVEKKDRERHRLTGCNTNASSVECSLIFSDCACKQTLKKRGITKQNQAKKNKQILLYRTTK